MDTETHIDRDDPQTVIVYTDGSCYPNPDGPGGWAFYCCLRGESALRYGHIESTTNNEAELLAILHTLRYIPAGDKYRNSVLIYTDSVYCKNAIMGWAAGWERTGWRTATGQPVKNVEAIKEIHALMLLHAEHRMIEVRWVKGHSGIPENELVDQRAGIARKSRESNWRKEDQRNYVIEK